jgi:hypothetical protein
LERCAVHCLLLLGHAIDLGVDRSAVGHWLHRGLRVNGMHWLFGNRLLHWNSNVWPLLLL